MPAAHQSAATARIAQAQRDQEATEAEQIAVANMAAVRRDARIKETAYQAERDARIAQAEAEAKETELRAAAQASQVKLAAAADAESVRLRGEAAGAATKIAGEAEAQAAQARGLATAEAAKALGLAEAEASQAKGLAEAQAIRARAQALKENQEAVIAQRLAERWPEVVEAGAKAFGNVDHMVVLNGAQGVEELRAKALTLGGTRLGLARALLNGGIPATHGETPNGAEPEIARKATELRE